jgi:glycosyltransferase involved in cell wall biosynthesis
VVIGHEECRKAVAGADLVNLHWWGWDPALFDLVRSRPRVTTLHWQAVLPRLPAVTICTSAYVREVQQDPRRCVAIPNGIDTERFTAPSRKPGKKVVITRVCRPPKCSPYFWDVVHELLWRYPNVRVQIVGNDSPAHHVSKRVRFLGVRRDIPEILREADLFLYTPYPEIGSKDLVVMEASAAGVPCVTSDVSVVRESIQDGRNGYMVRYGDVAATVERVSQLVERPAQRAAMGRAAARMAREEFDVRNVARKYEAVYAGVLAAQ